MRADAVIGKGSPLHPEDAAHAGRNRIHLSLDDLDAEIDRLASVSLSFRSGAPKHHMAQGHRADASGRGKHQLTLSAGEGHLDAHWIRTADGICAKFEASTCQALIMPWGIQPVKRPGDGGS
ncbi:hypothetical protein [Saccharopolyspora shandongensis]|uniref:hypothetical protein n=1 Tax=Saccharopolyspora shandongensis TaxID=418495 RepID=UPI00340268EF